MKEELTGFTVTKTPAEPKIYSRVIRLKGHLKMQLYEREMSYTAFPSPSYSILSHCSKARGKFCLIWYIHLLLFCIAIHSTKNINNEIFKTCRRIAFFPTYSGQNLADIKICAIQLKSLQTETYAQSDYILLILLSFYINTWIDINGLENTYSFRTIRAITTPVEFFPILQV